MSWTCLQVTLELAGLGAFVLLWWVFLSSPRHWNWLPIVFQQIYPDIGYPLQDCDKPKGTTEKESSVPQNQLFRCPFLLGETWKNLGLCCIQTANEAKITFKYLIPFTRPQGQLFCIILSASCASGSFYHSDCHICTQSHPPLIRKVQEGYCV